LTWTEGKCTSLVFYRYYNTFLNTCQGVILRIEKNSWLGPDLLYLYRAYLKLYGINRTRIAPEPFWP
jgi:hypothetical protein